MVVGWLHTVVGGEGSQRGLCLQEVAGHAPAALVARLFGGVGMDDRLVAPLQRADCVLELAPIPCVLVDLRRPGDALAEDKARCVELLLGGELFGVRLEVPAQLRPAELAPLGGQVRVCSPAVGGHDRFSVAE